MYGLAGERDLLERELAQFPGYAGSRPVRIGNGAQQQYQADVVGEVLVNPLGRERGGTRRGGDLVAARAGARAVGGGAVR